MAKDDPITCAIYARDNDLLNTEGWRQFKKRAQRTKRMIREIKQAKLRQTRRTTKYMFGVQIPKDYREALALDERNGNTKWQDATKLELAQLDEYNTFEDKGIARINNKKLINGPKGYKLIRVHLVFACKHNLRHKARLVAGGHLTGEPVESVYSSVVSLRSIRLTTFLAELNNLEVWGADVGNAYLEADTKERVFVIGGKEFGEREGHILIIRKALYGLKTSGKRYHEKFSDCMYDLGFKPCKADSDVWMRPSKDRSCYEYVATYVDDLMIAMKDPKQFCDTLKNKFGFKLKGDGIID
jgi:hypothetical protein